MTNTDQPNSGPPSFPGPSWPPPGGGQPPQPGPPPQGPGPGPMPGGPGGPGGMRPPHPQGPPPGYPVQGGWPPQQQRRKPNNGLGLILLLVALALVAYSLVSGSGGDSSSGTTSNNLTEVTVESRPGADYKVAVVDVTGMIMEGGGDTLFGLAPDPVAMVRDSLDRIDNDQLVKGVIFRVNSPGGGITASDKVYDMIAQHRDQWARDNRTVKIAVLMEDMATSGAYYLAAPADRIFAHPTTITGSIGVIMSSWNYSGLMDQFGIDDATITSVPNKDMGSPFREERPFEHDFFRQMLLEMQEQFVTCVHEGRSRVVKDLTLEQVNAWADGSVYTAKQALNAGLIDEIGRERDAIAWVQGQVDANQAPRVVHYQRRQSNPFSLLSMKSGDSAPDAATVAQQLSLIRDQLEQLRSRQTRPVVWAIWTGPSSPLTNN